VEKEVEASRTQAFSHLDLFLSVILSKAVFRRTEERAVGPMTERKDEWVSRGVNSAREIPHPAGKSAGLRDDARREYANAD
jgi:hypothetical protein